MLSERLVHLRALVDAQHWEQAWAEYQRLQSEGPCDTHVLYYGSRIALERQNHFLARQLAEAALAAYTEGDPATLLGHIRFHLGRIARYLGDTYVAMEQFQGFLEELSALYPELSMGESKACYYLALTLRQRRDLDGSVACYERAIHCARRDGLGPVLAKSLQNLAWIHCLQHRPQEAHRCLVESSELLTSRELRVHQILGEAHLALIEGDSLTAAERCETVFRQSGPGERATAEEQSQAAWVAGMVALQQGNLDSASALAEIALSYGTEARESRLINDAGSLRRQIYIRKQAGA
jgi:tetratricopeptide (TPR) repeat protein